MHCVQSWTLQNYKIVTGHALCPQQLICESVSLQDVVQTDIRMMVPAMAQGCCQADLQHCKNH